jgi:hypothetical protein
LLHGKNDKYVKYHSLGIALLISFCYGAQQQVLSLDYLSANTSLKKRTASFKESKSLLMIEKISFASISK